MKEIPKDIFLKFNLTYGTANWANIVEVAYERPKNLPAETERWTRFELVEDDVFWNQKGVESV